MNLTKHYKVLFTSLMRVACVPYARWHTSCKMSRCSDPLQTSKIYWTTPSFLKKWNLHCIILSIGVGETFYFSSPSGPPPGASFRPRMKPPGSSWLLPTWSRSPPV